MNVITSSCVDTHSNVMICVITISKQFGSIIQKRVPVGIVLDRDYLDIVSGKYQLYIQYDEIRERINIC